MFAHNIYIFSTLDNTTLTLTVHSYEDPTYYYNQGNISADDVAAIENFFEGKEKGTNTFHIKVNETIPMLITISFLKILAIKIELV